MNSELITPFCTVPWADAFITEFGFDTNWLSASPEKRLSAVKAATTFMELFAQFYDEDGVPVSYVADGTDDWEDAAIPRLVKQACAHEAVYLLSLDDNPAEPHPLTILGMLSADGKRFDAAMTPPIFPMSVVRTIERAGGEVDDEAAGSDRLQVRTMQNSF